MEAILKFNLPEDRPEFGMAADSGNMYSTIHEMDNWLRSQTKYAPDNMPKEVFDAYSECRDMLRELMYVNGVNFDYD